jgi:AraC family transcriptional regulator, regulatory protein of adaptative response / DNA-3-methyladenine glycosylase II
MRLSYREPFDWNGLLAWIAPRATPDVEEVVGTVYRRSIEMDGFAGVISLSPGRRSEMLLRVPVDAALVLARVADRARAMCDLGADPTIVTDELGADARLAAAARRYPGVRVPGCWDRFEMAVRAVLGQQISVTGATRLAGRLVERFGRPLTPAGPASEGPTSLFPRPADLADADIAAIGMPGARAETIRTLARAIEDGDPVLDLAPDLDVAVARLVALPGIGDWTAQYIAMRALREPDAFPAGDLGLRKALASESGALPTVAALRTIAEAWRPWRAYAAILLWRDLVHKESR